MTAERLLPAGDIPEARNFPPGAGEKIIQNPESIDYSLDSVVW